MCLGHGLAPWIVRGPFRHSLNSNLVWQPEYQIILTLSSYLFVANIEPDRTLESETSRPSLTFGVEGPQTCTQQQYRPCWMVALSLRWICWRRGGIENAFGPTITIMNSTTCTELNVYHSCSKNITWFSSTHAPWQIRDCQASGKYIDRTLDWCINVQIPNMRSETRSRQSDTGVEISLSVTLSYCASIFRISRMSNILFQSAL